MTTPTVVLTNNKGGVGKTRYSILKCELTQNRQKVAKAQDEVGHKCPRSNAEVIFQELRQALFPKLLPEGLIFELEAGA